MFKELLIAYAPTITAVVSMIVAVVKSIRVVKGNICDLKNANNVLQKQQEEILDKMDAVIAENIEVMKENRELKELITRVKQPGLAEPVKADTNEE